MKGIFKFKIEGYTFYLKKLEPYDFLDYERYPLSAFKIINETEKQDKRSKRTEKQDTDNVQEISNKLLEKSITKIKKRFKSYKYSDLKLEQESIVFLINIIIKISIGHNIINIDKTFALTLYNLSKIYSKLPSEILKLNGLDWSLNLIVTNTGVKNEYKEHLVSQLASCNIDLSGDLSIETLENILKSKMGKQHG